MSYETQLLYVFFFFFVFETPLKDIPLYCPIFHTLWFRYLQACIEESCMDLASQLFINTLHKTLKFQEKCISQGSADLDFKIFSFGVYHGATPQSHWIKQTVTTLNLWGKMALDKSAWIKAWLYLSMLNFKPQVKENLCGM